MDQEDLETIRLLKKEISVASKEEIHNALKEISEKYPENTDNEKVHTVRGILKEFDVIIKEELIMNFNKILEKV